MAESDELRKQVERQAQRMQKAERERPTLLSQTVYAGTLGLLFVLPVIGGAYLFGAVTIGQLHAQALGFGIPSQLLSSLPYLATILVLVLISRDRRLTVMNTPASLAQPFVPDR